jgi:Ca2+-binding EF-hand superfamily protein
MRSDDVVREQADLQLKIDELRKRIQDYDNSPTSKIHSADLNEAMRLLGRKCTKKEIEDMIWEVDENLDGCVDWEEFLTMFERNIMDTSGLEPFQLFNVVQFMMYDKDNSGNVTVDETMHMLYARYGKQHLESQMKALFGEDLKTADGDGELSFEEYLKTVSAVFKSSPNKAFI